ncbi:MAG: hypothetical protein K940chlam9_01328, partial [Chlamydiae bacterium]|nr:hypothetical protein [Chlamydiota bacterium]
PSSPAFLSSLTTTVGKMGMIGIASGSIFVAGTLLAFPFLYCHKSKILERNKQGTILERNKQELEASLKNALNKFSEMQRQGKVSQGWTLLHYYASNLYLEGINALLDNAEQSPLLIHSNNADESDGDLPFKVFARALLVEIARDYTTTKKDHVREIPTEKIKVARRLSSGVADIRSQLTVISADNEEAWEALCSRIEGND